MHTHRLIEAQGETVKEMTLSYAEWEMPVRQYYYG